MINVPPEVLAVRDVLEHETKDAPGILGIGITYNGEEWAVTVIRGPGPRVAVPPSEMNGVKIYAQSAAELAELDTKEQ